MPRLNILLSSHVWRQDHNGFSHQDPGFLDHVITRSRRHPRLPAARREHAPVGHRSLPQEPPPRQRDRRRKQAAPQCLRGRGPCITRPRARPVEFFGASNEQEGEPDVVLACAGDVPTHRDGGRCRPAAHARPRDPRARRQVVDLRTLLSAERDTARRLRRRLPVAVHARDKPIIFAFHGYPWLIHRLTIAGRITGTPVRATRRRARRRRRSTWSCSTTSTRSTWSRRRRPRTAPGREGRLREEGDAGGAGRAPPVRRALPARTCRRCATGAGRA